MQGKWRNNLICAKLPLLEADVFAGDLQTPSDTTSNEARL